MKKQRGRLKTLRSPLQSAPISSVGSLGSIRANGKRDTSTSRGYGYRWQQARERWLQKHPMCAECARKSQVTIATLVDHITPHRGNQALFWDESNWQSLCVPCHAVKTARGE